MYTRTRKRFTMKKQRTLILFKPDAVKKNCVGECLSRFEKEGFSICGIKMMQLDETILAEHYAHIKDLVVNGTPIFPSLVEYMSGGPVIALCLCGEDVIGRVRDLLGPTDSAVAPKGTIRGDFGESKTRNVCHASDSEESAQVEIARFFKPHEIFPCSCCS